jgi:hypothetical protein
MNRPGNLLLVIAGVTLVAAVASAEQAKPAVTPPAAPTQKPNDEGAPKKLVPRVRGEAEVGYTKPVSKNDGQFITTTFKIKNLASGPIPGLKVEEFWYDKDGNPVTGSQPFMLRKPFQPGEVVDIVLKVPINKNMNRNQYKFTYGDGKTDKIKTTLLPKL